MKRNLTTAVAVLMAVMSVAAGCITITLNKKGTDNVNTVQPGHTYNIPVSYSSNTSAGSIQFELVCSDSEIEILSISEGFIAENAILKYNIYEPGRVLIGLVHSQGMKGDGELAKIEVSARGAPRVVRISIENVVAYDLDRMQPMLYETAEGKIDFSNNTIVSPSLKYLAD
jgi:hypothetical protein